MYLRTRRRALRLFKLFVVMWVVIILYLYFTLDGLPAPWRSERTLVLKRLMATAGTQGNAKTWLPLSELVVPEWDSLSFYHLAKRRRGVMYGEVTSANRDSSYPLAPDFTFHIQYAVDHVVLYEDYGPACIHRIYLFPVLPTHADLLYKMTADDLTDSFISFVMDDMEYKYSLKQFMQGLDWPFMSPMNTRHKVLASGMGAYIPICYQKSMKISYLPNDKLPRDLFAVNVNCTRHDLHCPVHIYSSISRLKYPPDTQVEVFTSEKTYQSRAEHVNKLLERPQDHGPDAQSPCYLKCMEICKGCQRVLFQTNSPGVLTSIKMRVFETASSKLRSDWTDILISITFDDAINPQIDRVPLGSLFGATASLNEFSAAAFGKTKIKCVYDEHRLNVPNVDITGYFYFPMPFWKNIKIMLYGTNFIDTPLLLCQEITVENNYYEQSETGYFSVKKTYYSDEVSGWREVLKVESLWGQLVGLTMDVDNLRALRNVPVSERWAPLQADALVYVDDSKAATVLGTGLEDYFSYAHGFAMAENTTYAFVGNYHAAPKRKEPLTWHCYRLHVLDPIYFRQSLHFIMEGMSREGFHNPQAQLSFDEHFQRKRSGEGCLSHMVLYYSGDTCGVTTTDVFHLGHAIAEQEHHFEILQSPSKSELTFHMAGKRYLGGATSKESFDVDGRRFSPGDKFSFTMTCLEQNRGAILRREFHSIPWVSWNEKARIWVNNRYIGVWFIPMGALSPEYSLMQDDFSIARSAIENKHLEITIEALTAWNDISYRLLNIS